IFVMVGGTLLLLTGIGMGLLRPALFQMFWYDASLVLFLLALAAGPVVLSPLSKPIKTLLYNYPEGEEVIPESYENLANQLFLNDLVRCYSCIIFTCSCSMASFFNSALEAD